MLQSAFKRVIQSELDGQNIAMMEISAEAGRNSYSSVPGRRKAMSEVVRFSVCLLLLGKELLREAGGDQVPRVKV
jgi:hypothetical protein